MMMKMSSMKVPCVILVQVASEVISLEREKLRLKATLMVAMMMRTKMRMKEKMLILMEMMASRTMMMTVKMMISDDGYFLIPKSFKHNTLLIINSN